MAAPKRGFFTMSPMKRVFLYSAIMAISTGLFGFDTGTIGSITTMPQFQAQFGVLSDFVRGLVVASILIPSAFTGIIAGSISDRLSRKRTVSLGCAIFACGSAISCGSNTLGLLIFGRCVAGAGETMLVIQVFTTGAIATGFFICYASVRIPSSLSWRLPFALSTMTATFVAVASLLLPYSPRWLVMKGRRAEAEAVMDLIASEASPDERRELLEVPMRVPSKKLAFMDMFRKGYRGRTILGAFLQAANQLSGIDFISFSSTWAVIIHTAEIQPNATRAAATAFGNGVNQAVNFCVAVTGPGFLARSAYGPYFTYGSCTLFATVVAYLYMPETIGKTLETIDITFEGSPYAPSAFVRPKSTATIVNAVRDVRQLALPLAFVSVKGWEEDGIAGWMKWAKQASKAGYTSVLVEIDPADAATRTEAGSSSSALLAELSAELSSILSSPESGTPFPPLLLSASLSSLLAQTYVSSHPLSALLLHSPAPPAPAHELHPKVFPTPLEEFTFEPNFPVAIARDPGDPERGSRLEDGSTEGEYSDVTVLAAGKDKDGWEVVARWMDENGL
ncbi:hypothetical protein RQP46_007320 [Phenoliferia psychrophenolica]